jgi:acetylornithine/succinyldiaminopimelate/putrescine aminotransferase
VKALDGRYVLGTYRRFPVVFERGDGVRIFDDQGKSYLDFVSGIGVAALGHAHPGLAKAIADQAATLIQTSNLYFHPLQGELAARLASLTGLDRTFFCNGGTEAVGVPEVRAQPGIRAGNAAGPVTRSHAFHGRTMGSLSVTWDEHYRAIRAAGAAGDFVDASTPDALADVVDDTSPRSSSSRSGARRLRRFRGARAAIRAATARTGAPSSPTVGGSGRTGTFRRWASRRIVSLGSARRGAPIGAAVLSAKVASTAAPSDHGSTARQSAFACRRARRPRRAA